ncbi:TetR/AcrR family transcriptional regulator [Cognatishimia sp. WU-CL00825]|uniref:TetR/AcrR family transcriptional regulator n=1 Tax=Cognatishimia sp. WU-CL00825 TaxID=3127658 RepID=UPI00310564AA
MNTQAPIQRKGRKVDQVLAGAREVFLRDGFEGASVDDIARQSGVSKATLYSYFSDKRQLFVDVVTCECDRMAVDIVSQFDEDTPLRDCLKTAAIGLTTYLLSDFAQKVFRICVAESDRFPELGQAYYQSGPAKGQAMMCEYLKESIAQGELVIDNIPMAAEQFSELCKARLFLRASFGVQTEFDAAEIETVAEEAVQTFLARYGA